MTGGFPVSPAGPGRGPGGSAKIAEQAIRRRLAKAGPRPLVVGICGAQGSGKSRLAAALASRFGKDGVATAILSLDDLYLTRAEREVLAREVHPLLRTRGVPGTHDVALGLRIFDRLDRGLGARLPRFDKKADDRLPRDRWERAPAATRLLLFEGWCVGARPEAEAALERPVNALEREEDEEGRWRRFANQALGGPYQKLFARIDHLVLLAAPSFEIVESWRGEQERDLALEGSPGPLMDEAGIRRFVAHYERLTRHILAEMPGRADLLIRLGADRSPLAVVDRQGERRDQGGSGGQRRRR